MTIRKATINDLYAIVDLLADDELGQIREQLKNPLPTSYIKAFETITEDAHQELMVVENESSEIIGTFQLTFIQYLNYSGGLRAQVETVQIRKDHRSLGIGKRIFEWIIQHAKARNAIILQLTSDKKRPRAIKFYEALGFTATHEGMKMHF
ncbi:acyl-CoA N-acyltransferase (GNAT) family protein [Formosa agariphila KMM 3901]|uniref:Acyl-CoA N-acyltransferase (GNAT) family protein n=1 Tax=Formosa agariphila (strain DSM 15362 / KCTC 12365 / LMG 23005 / KMM 3901 / M-2Alg 35-1) TaxID=1347342 RepID=T2KM52_FORAG|nr:GNAT family N-acetyltransferase [Formosa agariphila]CDF79084.1 acyl-CoA N-acyltransferase (GNAT) family protein [Formosa agariphila KMM 3901]